MRVRSRSRRWLARAIDKAVRWRLPEQAPELAGGSALVIAPHPDDESLACGGVLARLAAAGSPVTVVIVTDGARANTKAMGQAEAAGIHLPDLRRREASDACSRLGLPPGSVRFLDLPDGRVRSDESRAMRLLAELLAEIEPTVVVHPDPQDSHPDHAAVGRAALAAASGSGRPLVLYGYQVWLWHSWPWTSQGWRRPRQWPANGRRAVRCLRWVLAGRTVQVRLTPDELGRKHDAIEAHASQVSAPVWAADWAVLGDISEGDFLGRFLRPVELFQVRRIG